MNNNRRTTLNKICFGLGTVGRDALYSLVSMYLLVHLTDVVGFSDNNLAVIGVMLTLFGTFDAVIDPFVGAIVDNTKTRWGKFKPWIFIGMIGTGVLTVLMFHNFEMSETAHIILLAVTYLLFSIFFSLNDIAYWSLMPAISKDQKVREGVGAFARICANVGMFSMVLIYLNGPGFFEGLGLTDRDSYFYFAIIIAVIMWIFQSITLIGVKEDRTNLEKVEHTTIKDLFRALFKNDQLLVTAVSMALFMIGYCSTTGFGTYYFKYAYKDEGMYMVFAAVLAVAQLTALSVFPLFRKKFTRKQLYTGSMIAVTISYLVFFLSFEWLPLIVLHALHLCNLRIDILDQHICHRTVRRSQSHTDSSLARRIEIDLVNQSQVIDIYGNFGIVYVFESQHYIFLYTQYIFCSHLRKLKINRSV